MVNALRSRLPAHSGLRPASPAVYRPSPATVACLSHACGLESADIAEVALGGSESRFFQLRPGHGGPVLFLKLVPPAQAASQCAANRMAALACRGGVRASCLAEGFPMDLMLDGKLWTMLGYPLVEGRYSSGSTSDLERLGEALGRLHHALAQAGSMANAVSLAWDTVSRSLVERWSDLASGCRDVLPTDTELADAVIRAFADTPVWLPSAGAQTIHGDVHPANVLFTGAGPVFLDFEDTPHSWLPPAVDLAFALERFILVQRNDEMGVLERGAALIGGWRREGLSWTIDAPLATVLAWLSRKALCRLADRALHGLPVPPSEWRKFLELLSLHASRHSLVDRLGATLHG